MPCRPCAWPRIHPHGGGGGGVVPRYSSGGEFVFCLFLKFGRRALFCVEHALPIDRCPPRPGFLCFIDLMSLPLPPPSVCEHVCCAPWCRCARPRGMQRVHTVCMHVLCVCCVCCVSVHVQAILLTECAQMRPAPHRRGRLLREVPPRRALPAFLVDQGQILFPSWQKCLSGPC